METNQIATSQNKDQVSDEMMKTIEIYTESQDEFPVDFDQFWQWCGFARKDNAKRVLEKNFTQLADYQVFRSKAENPKGGRPSQIILLSVECAKAFAMLAETSKGREVRRYFIDCEKQLKALSVEAHQRIEYLEELNFEMLLLKEEIMTMKAEQVRGKESEERVLHLPDMMPEKTHYPAYPNYRKALTNYIEKYAEWSNQTAQSLYNKLYRQFNAQYQIDLYAEAEKEELTMIEWLEEEGWVMHAHTLATQMFRFNPYF